MGIGIYIGNTIGNNKGNSPSWTPPSDLIVDVVSGSQIDLSWANNGTLIPDTTIKIERSLDSNTWSEIATVAPTESSYTDEDVTADTVVYFYRVRYVEGLSHSAYTRITSMFWNEMVSENDFSTGVRWLGQNVANWSVTGGEAIFSASGSTFKVLYRDTSGKIPVIAGRTYRVTFEVSAGATPRFKIGSSTAASVFAGALNDYAVYSVGIHTFDVACILSSDTLGITGDNTSGSFRLTSFSVKDKTYPTPYVVLPAHSSCHLSGSVLYGVNGLYLEKSLDFGDTWVRINHEFTATFKCFVSKDGILFANVGVQGVGGTEIWRSADDGLNWTKVMNTNKGYIQIPWNFAQSASGTMFMGEYIASDSSAYLWKSTDNGVNWTRIDYFYAAYDHFHQVFVDPETQRLYVTVGDTTKDTYISDDEGDTWTQIFIGGGEGFVSITSVPGVRFFGSDATVQTVTISKSTDDLALINIYRPPEKYAVVWCEVISIEGTDILYAMFTNNAGVAYGSLLAKSIDRGDTWNIIMVKDNVTQNFNLPTSDYRHRIPAAFDYLITHTHDLGLIRVGKGIETWACLNKPTNLTPTLITGGARLNWTDNSGGRLETEIWGYSTGGVSAFIATVNPGISTYDDIITPVPYRYYKARTKIRFNYSDFTDEESIAFSTFTTTWQTENAGSATKTIVIPTTGGGYDGAYIKWDDEDWVAVASDAPGNITHTFSTTGVKTIKIVGPFPRILFNNAGDKLKLLTIESWGGIVWSNMANAFYGCANLTGNYFDFPDVSHVSDMSNMFMGCAKFNSTVNFNTSNVTVMSSMFNGCALFNQSVASFNTSKVTLMSSMFNGCLVFNQSVASFDTSNITTMASMFYNCHAFNQSLATWNTVKVTTMASMFYICTAFNQSLAAFDIHLVTTMTNMLISSNAVSTANYDATLISWATQSVKDNVAFHAGDAKYSAGDAATARAHLVLAVASGGHGWTITDGGAV